MVIGYWLLVIGYWLLVIIIKVNYQLPTAHYQLPTANCPRLTNKWIKLMLCLYVTSEDGLTKISKNV
ncbi:MAG: hypothetical protein EAZ78_10315 [Oscillatoriales cyanobacterium]|nr:MAG: hypothetical protein EA000_15940 [Oscillatoriales cyanobacterium]TAD95825.1 MAG: hypothetical protein EAZ98_14390 [Oscillatoriales cyanobacterium]TAE03462.1 MAG: hypothetical protein EAZ96_12790 [Oscillatoriales cyanobacterium]TAF04075.1 MAG: hypothetical protein EAZ78_10315 [Oscillatoriales cyanobacterium]TAF48009.1 MAG: hypothetical protein EAZ68_00485 [Oscillatoriales cyanobacterium]